MRSSAKWTVIILSLTALRIFPSFAESRVSHPAISAHDLVRAVIANELRPQADPTHWMYKVDKEQDGEGQTKEVVQTSNGSMEQLLAVNGHSLSPEKRREEMERIKRLPDHLQEHRQWEQAQKKAAEEAEVFMKMIPDAFMFTYAGSENGLVKLMFKPNPNYQPPSREGRVLHAMEGEVLVDADEKRLAGISGHLVEEVKFGGGLLGYLEKGGRFSVMRTEVAPAEWVLSAMEIDMKGKALFLKTIAVQQKEYRHDFHRLPADLTLRDAAELLVSQVLLAANH